MLSRVAHDQVLADGVPLEVVSVTPSLLLTGWRMWQWEPELLSWTRRGTVEADTGRAPRKGVWVPDDGGPSQPSTSLSVRKERHATHSFRLLFTWVCYRCQI